MIPTKSKEDIKKMAEGGRILSGALESVLKEVREGVSTAKLNQIAEDYILKKAAKPSFKSVEGYEYTTCINVNSGLVHGLPGEYRLAGGDLISVDLGVFFKGFHTDMAYTLEVGTRKHTKFLRTGERALDGAIKKCVPGNRIGDIGNAVQKIIEKAGYSVSRDLVGHGVGGNLHEEPLVPGYGKKGTGAVIKEGMVLAIEVIYQQGGHEIKLAANGWTIETADGSLAALFEHTVAITGGGPQVLTRMESLPLDRKI